VPLGAEIGDAAFQHITRREEPVLAEANAWRRSGRQQVAPGTSVMWAPRYKQGL